MSTQTDLLNLQAALIGDTMDMLVTEWAGQDAWLDEAGNIRIRRDDGSTARVAHSDLLLFASWLSDQDLDAAQARHSPEWAAAKA